MYRSHSKPFKSVSRTPALTMFKRTSRSKVSFLAAHLQLRWKIATLMICRPKRPVS